MGRKSRLKKARREAKSQLQDESSIHPSTPNPTQFVKQLEQQGYSLKQTVRSPQLPEDRSNPQV